MAKLKNTTKIGKLYDKSSLIMRYGGFEKKIDGMGMCIQCNESGKRYIFDWKDLHKLAINAGIGVIDE